MDIFPPDLRLLGRVQPCDPAALPSHNARRLLPLAQRGGVLQSGLLEASPGPSVSHAGGGGQTVRLPTLRGEEEHLFHRKLAGVCLTMGMTKGDEAKESNLQQLMHSKTPLFLTSSAEVQKNSFNVTDMTIHPSIRFINPRSKNAEKQKHVFSLVVNGDKQLWAAVWLIG